MNSCFRLNRLEFFQVELIRESLYHLGGTFIGSGTSALVDGGVCARGVPRSSIPKSWSKVSPSHSTVAITEVKGNGDLTKRSMNRRNLIRKGYNLSSTYL